MSRTEMIAFCLTAFIFIATMLIALAGEICRTGF
ncbi:hypothetical protein C8D98_2236 [Seleniivibrio woodruffii]|uniref:Uncharacterized protein n=1 Tax=Seleniivibrio woodruffii TaxID=1078050 RepID=A0A4R1K7P2_9BACT|nr:hypothetical protein C8D98_2236 [Seleniivibrio woodruffii]